MKKLFKVNIIETGELQVEIEAETPEQAIEIAIREHIKMGALPPGAVRVKNFNFFAIMGVASELPINSKIRDFEHGLCSLYKFADFFY